MATSHTRTEQNSLRHFDSALLQDRTAGTNPASRNAVHDAADHRACTTLRARPAIHYAPMERGNRRRCSGSYKIFRRESRTKKSHLGTYEKTQAGGGTSKRGAKKLARSPPTTGGSESGNARQQNTSPHREVCSPEHLRKGLQRPRKRPRQRPGKTARQLLRRQKHANLLKVKQKNRQKRKLIANPADMVLNLSTCTLSNTETILLAKGLSFIPKPKKLDIKNLYRDTNLLVKRMRTRYELFHQPHKPKSKFWKPKPQNPYAVTDNAHLENTIEQLKLKMVQIEYTQSKTDNLTRNERRALVNLTARTDIVINKADKGSTIVILDRTQYISDGLKHLSDTTVYEPLREDITPELKNKILTKLHGLYIAGMLDKEMTEFCTPPKQHRTSVLYFLKKIHKNPMGIRPIVSSINSITENISQFVDIWLQPIMRNLPSFIKDTTEFINLIENTPFPMDCILASIDVSSLYTNIPHLDGKTAAVQFLSQIEDPDPRQPPSEVIGELIDIVLQNNVFEFDGKFYLQRQGTAMGTKMAPAYANIFMGNLEPTLQAEGQKNILIWKRFIDDIFIV